MSTCNSCGCTKTTAACPSCDADEFAMIPIQKRRSDGVQYCEDSDSCPPMEEYYSETNKIFYIPQVGETSELGVCDPSRYSPGQWVRVQGAGLFFIDAVNDDTLTVRNACPDAESPIDENDLPGRAFASGTRFWLTAQPAWPNCLTDEDFCNIIADCLSSATDICLTSIDEATEVDEFHLFGGTAAESCLKKLLNVVYFAGALCYKVRSGVGGAKVSDGGTLKSKKFVVHTVGDGCDNQLELPSENAANGMYKYCDGNIEFIEEARFYQYQNELLYDDSISLTVGSQDIPITLPNFPSGCGDVIAIIHLQIFATTPTSADYFQFEALVEGNSILIFGANEQYDAPLVVSFPAHNDNTIPVLVASDNIDINLVAINPSISGTAEIKCWLRGYYI